MFGRRSLNRMDPNLNSRPNQGMQSAAPFANPVIPPNVGQNPIQNPISNPNLGPILNLSHEDQHSEVGSDHLPDPHIRIPNIHNDPPINPRNPNPMHMQQPPVPPPYHQPNSPPVNQNQNQNQFPMAQIMQELRHMVTDVVTEITYQNQPPPTNAWSDHNDPGMANGNSMLRFPPIGGTFHPKTDIIRLLPEFHGLSQEDPIQHIDNFLSITDTITVPNVSSDYIRMKLFPFTLKDKGNYWLRSLSKPIFNWTDLRQTFLRKFYPIGKTSAFRNAILNFKPKAHENFYDSWDRFNELLRKCPHHELPRWQLIQIFYYGLSTTDKGLCDASSGGNFCAKGDDEAWELLETLAENAQTHASMTEYDRTTTRIAGLKEIERGPDPRTLYEAYKSHKEPGPSHSHHINEVASPTTHSPVPPSYPSHSWDTPSTSYPLNSLHPPPLHISLRTQTLIFLSKHIMLKRDVGTRIQTPITLGGGIIQTSLGNLMYPNRKLRLNTQTMTLGGNPKIPIINHPHLDTFNQDHLHLRIDPPILQVIIPLIQTCLV